ncbi:hypothetical protein [Salinicoccus sp. HZC-1]|uniref:hypothetical protein n=1 Tax=Salinicoccus sp. HZC-1 TaxID=3385497 RepID=UPI00398B7C9F
MKKLIGVLILGLMLISSVSFSNPETVEASIVKPESAEFGTAGGAYTSDGRLRPIDVY